MSYAGVTRHCHLGWRCTRLPDRSVAPPSVKKSRYFASSQVPEKAIEKLSTGRIWPSSSMPVLRAPPTDAIGAPSVMTVVDRPLNLVRSEEHTSELQSLMRISYAVSCLKKTHIRQN